MTKTELALDLKMAVLNHNFDENFKLEVNDRLLFISTLERKVNDYNLSHFFNTKITNVLKDYKPSLSD